MRKVVLVFAFLAFAVPSAFAQDKAVEWNLGAGVSFPTGDIGKEFDTGWNGAIGVTFYPSPTVGFQVEYMYQRFGGPDRAFEDVSTPVADTILIESNHQLHSGTFNLVARSQSGGAVNGYFLVGPGVYYRKVQLTSPGVGLITVCDPYWLVCYPAPVETTQVLGDRTSTDFGVNFGGGITFGQAAKFYIEARYHYVWGPKVSVAGTDFSSNAQYVPITFGVRF
jgi:opacity protein-like surface antigen